MDYEKKYKDAQKWIESIYTELNHERQMEAEAFFPELKESEDEKTRKQILSFLKDFERDHYRNLDFNSWIAWLEKQGEQVLANSAKTCKVEQKFKVGDWVTDGLSTMLITNIHIKYEVVYISGNRDFRTVDYIDNNFHLWTIQDAKDGEVIAWDNSNCIALFKNIYDKESFHSHGFVGHITGEFVSEISYHDIAGAHPATKEECELFFQKMKEAGYEWDAEKKELKKIEGEHKNYKEQVMSEITDSVIDYIKQKAEQSNEGNCEIEGLYYAKNILEKTLGKVEGYQTDDGILEHKSAINAVTKLCEQKSVEENKGNIGRTSSNWSEVDDVPFR